MNFKTVEEAENYYMSHLAQTNNAHEEEDAKMDRWLEDQEIDEVNDAGGANYAEHLEDIKRD
jgi:hypothetical protein